ncbi:hypothetical protein L1887_47120 [Cichorium endivia]|nr:hypothetical protein L1887_47120 [Cichorium endivia]
MDSESNILNSEGVKKNRPNGEQRSDLERASLNRPAVYGGLRCGAVGGVPQSGPAQGGAFRGRCPCQREACCPACLTAEERLFSAARELEDGLLVRVIRVALGAGDPAIVDVVLDDHVGATSTEPLDVDGMVGHRHELARTAALDERKSQAVRSGISRPRARGGFLGDVRRAGEADEFTLHLGSQGTASRPLGLSVTQPTGLGQADEEECSEQGEHHRRKAAQRLKRPQAELQSRSGEVKWCLELLSCLLLAIAWRASTIYGVAHGDRCGVSDPTSWRGYGMHLNHATSPTSPRPEPSCCIHSPRHVRHPPASPSPANPLSHALTCNTFTSDLDPRAKPCL